MKLIKTLLMTLMFLMAGFNAWAEPVDINTADAKTLSENLKGIGMKKAEAIVKYREKHGAFKTADDLAQVEGIGEKTVELNRQDILLEPAQTSKP